MPTEAVNTQKKARASPDSLQNRDHRRHPITQTWMHWVRMKAREREIQKKEVSADELLADLHKQRFLLYDPDPEAEKVLYWLTKGILAGPKEGYYQIPARTGFKAKTCFSQHPDPTHPRHQPIAPKAKNLTASKLYQDPASKAVSLEVVIETQDDTWEGHLAIENGRLKLDYPITLGRLLKVFPEKI